MSPMNLIGPMVLLSLMAPASPAASMALMAPIPPNDGPDASYDANVYHVSLIRLYSNNSNCPYGFDWPFEL